MQTVGVMMGCCASVMVAQVGAVATCILHVDVHTDKISLTVLPGAKHDVARAIGSAMLVAVLSWRMALPTSQKTSSSHVAARWKLSGMLHM